MVGALVEDRDRVTLYLLILEERTTHTTGVATNR